MNRREEQRRSVDKLAEIVTDCALHEANKLVEELQVRIAELDWHEVSENPTEGRCVDVWSDNEIVHMLYYENGKYMVHEHTSYEWEWPISHWKYYTQPKLNQDE